MTNLDDLLAQAEEWVQDMLSIPEAATPGVLISDLAAAVRALRDENDEMHEDVIRFLTHRNIVCQRAAAHVIPGPDGQDDIDRRRLIDEWLGDGWQEMAAKGAAVIAERDALQDEVRALCERTPND